MAISRSISQDLLNSTGRTMIYMAAGIALFGVVVKGVVEAYAESQTVPAPLVRVETARASAPLERYVPPAEVTYPFF